MATRIKLKRGSGVPNESQLQEHEVAMDVSTGTIYVGSSSTDAGTDCAVLAEKNQANDTYTDAEAIAAVEGEATLDLTGDVSIGDNKSLTLNNSHGQNRHTVVESKAGGTGGLQLTALNSLTNNRRLDMIFRQTNGAGDTTEAIGSFDAVYSTTEADKRFQLRVFDSDGSEQANPHLEVRHTGDTVIRNNNLRFKEMDGTDVFTAKVNSSAVGGHDAQLYGSFDMVPEVTTETDLSLMQLKPDFGSNTIPDGADVKLNFQVRNDADGVTSLGRFSAVYDADAADRKFRMSSPDGSNSMEFFNSKTRLDSTVELDTSDTTKIRNVSGDLVIDTDGGMKIDRDSSSLTDDDLTLYRDAGSAALEGSGGKANRVPVRMNYTLESDADGEFLVARTEGFKHHSNDKPVFEIDVHSDGDSSTGNFENYITGTNNYVYVNQKLQVWQDGSPYRLALSIDPDDTSLISNNSSDNADVTLRVEKNTTGDSIDNVGTIIELSVNDAYNDTSSDGNRYVAAHLRGRRRSSGSGDRAELALMVDEDDGDGTGMAQYITLQGDGNIYFDRNTSLYPQDGKFEVFDSSFNKIFATEDDSPIELVSRNTYATGIFRHEMDASDSTHTMVKFETDLQDQAQRTHKMGFTAETTGDNIDSDNDEGFCGALQFEWRTDGNHKILFNADNYQDSVYTNRRVIEATTSVVEFDAMLRMDPIETDTTTNRPASPDAGDLFFNTTTKNLQMYTDDWQDISNQKGMMFTSDGGVLYFYDGTNWKPVTLGTAL